jgi:AcrR family transcriptional regulator
MDEQPGLRERKRQQTWGLIAQTARQLFKEHSFDAVTVDDIARQADVSRKTVFNYFPTKEDLFFSAMEVYEAQLLEAIHERRPGESILAAFVRSIVESRGLLDADDPQATERLYAIARMIAESPRLRAREQQIYAGYAAALAALVAEETKARPDDVGPWIAANAMVGVHKALVDYVRRQVLAGECDRARIVRGLRAQAKQAVAMLEDGLGRIGVR